jgi:putative ABC transport system permease protein
MTFRNFITDLRQALRGFRRHPMLFLGADVTLALGVFAAVALGTAFYRVLLKPLPYPGSGRILALSEVLPGSGDFGLMTCRDFTAIKEHATHLQAMGASRIPRGATETFQGQKRDLRSLSVSSGWLETLGVKPALGEAFRPEHENGRFVILGHRFWRTEFQGDKAVLGRQLDLGARKVLVMGILPQGFTTPGGWEPDLLVSLDRDEAQAFGFCLQGVARMAPGTSPSAIRPDLDALAKRLGASGQFSSGVGIQAQPLANALRFGRSTPLLALLGGGFLLLLAACANVAGLFLARTLERGGDTCIRLALGAQFRHILRFHFAEGLLVGLAGGVLGTLGAWCAVRSMPSWLPVDPGRAAFEPSGPEGAELAGASLVVLAACLWVALVPTLHGFRRDLGQVLKAGEHGASPTGRSWSLLLVGQVAITTLLVACAGLASRSLLAHRHAELGFEPRDLYQISLALPDGAYSSPRFLAARRQAMENLKALPGVASVASGIQPVFKNLSSLAGLLPADQDVLTTPLDAWNQAILDTVDGDYLRTLHIPLREGREMGAEEVPDGPRPILVNQTFAQCYCGGRALGRTFHAAWGTSKEEAVTARYQIVGVLADSRLESPKSTPAPRALMLASQLAYQGETTRLFLRMRPGQRPSWEAIRTALLAAAPDATVGQPESVANLGLDLLGPDNLQARLAGAFASLSLLLSAMSIFVAISAHTARRRRETAIRAAMGATFLQQCRVLLRPALLQVSAGVVLGLAGVFALGRVLQSLYLGVAPLDPLALGGCIATILAATILACLRPALRIGRMNPAEELRN